jgi:hypothetical protein
LLTPASTRFRRAASACLGAVPLLLLAGCGLGTKLEYAEVEGTVTLGGKSLSGVNVTFYPDSEGAEQLPYATGKTDDAGRYTLTLQSGKPGALVGKNRVVVSWPAPERRDDQPRPPPPGPAIPVRYTVVTETPLVVEVEPGGRQTIDLPLN